MKWLVGLVGMAAVIATVRERRIRSLEALGVTGVITNDPRLFDSGAQAIEQLAAE